MASVIRNHNTSLLKDPTPTDTASFRNKSKKKSTELSKYMWVLKDNNIQHNSKWYIASKARRMYAEVESAIYA